MYSYSIRGSLEPFLCFEYWYLTLDRLFDLESSLLLQWVIAVDRLEVLKSSLLPDLCVDGFDGD